MGSGEAQGLLERDTSQLSGIHPPSLRENQRANRDDVMLHTVLSDISSKRGYCQRGKLCQEPLVNISHSQNVG